MDTRRRFTQGLLLAGAGVSVGLIALGIYRRRSHITRMDREIFSHISVGELLFQILKNFYNKILIFLQLTAYSNGFENEN